MPYVSTSKEALKYTAFLGSKASRKLRMYHWNNKIDHIPKCIITNKDAHFSYIGYSSVCKELFIGLVQYDKQINVVPFRWCNLLYSGAPADELIEIKKNKYFHKIRDTFNECKTKSDFEKQLLKMDFKQHVVSALIENLNFSNWNSIKEFVSNFYKLTKGFKNNTKEYYINRGYSEIEAKDKIYQLCNYWEKFKYKLDNDPLRKQAWIKSRMHGLKKNRSKSKFEIKLCEALLNASYDVNTNYEINFYSIPPEYNAITNKARFRCDFLVNNTHIIEYNRSYWHKDIFVKRHNFSINQYLAEIQKAKFLRYLTFKKIILLWECDIKNDINLAIDIIHKSIQNKSIFNSSRKIDYNLYKFLLQGGTVNTSIL